jgi:hypothetical protein
MGWLVSLRGDDIAVGGHLSEASFPQRVLSTLSGPSRSAVQTSGKGEEADFR